MEETKKTPKSKFAPYRRPLIAAGALLGGGLLAMKFLAPASLVKIDLQKMLDDELYLNISGNDLVFENRDGKVLYVVQYLEPTDGGENIDWRTIEVLEVCEEHTSDYYCLVMIANGEERHARYFVCKKA